MLSNIEIYRYRYGLYEQYDFKRQLTLSEQLGFILSWSFYNEAILFCRVLSIDITTCVVKLLPYKYHYDKEEGEIIKRCDQIRVYGWKYIAEGWKRNQQDKPIIRLEEFLTSPSRRQRVLAKAISKSLK